MLGNYLNKRSDLYSSLLDLYSLKLQKKYTINKKKILNSLSKSQKKIERYILNNLQIDKDKLGEEKVIEILNKKFF